VWQSVDGGEQAVPECVDIDFITTQDRDEIAVSEFKQFDEPMLNLDIWVGARFAQTDRVFESLGTVLIEAAQ